MDEGVVRDSKLCGEGGREREGGREGGKKRRRNIWQFSSHLVTAVVNFQL